MSRLGPTAGLYKPVFAAPSGAGLRAPKTPESALAPTGLEGMPSLDVDAAVGRLRALASELGAAPPEPEQESTRPYIAFSPSSKQMFVNGFTFAENDATRALESEQYLGQSAKRPEGGDWQRIPASVYQDYLQSIRDPSAGTRFAKSFSSGVGSLQQLWGAALMAATDGGAGQGLYEAGTARMERLQPFAKKFSEVKNLDDAGDFMVSLIGSQAPNILESITTALIGAGLGAAAGTTTGPVGTAAGGLGGAATGFLAKGAVKNQLKTIANKKLAKQALTPDEDALWKREAGRTGTAIQLAARKKAAGEVLSPDEQKLIRQGAAVTGALTLSTLENYGIGVGDIYSEMLEKGVADEPGARAAAFGYAIPYAALSTAPEFLGALALFRPTTRTGLRAAAGRFGTGFAVGAVGEGVSEASQEGLIMGAAEGFGAQYTPRERGERLLEAGVAGAVLGGITGGPINLLRRPERDAGITPPAAPTAPAAPPEGPTLADIPDIPSPPDPESVLGTPGLRPPPPEAPFPSGEVYEDIDPAASYMGGRPEEEEFVGAPPVRPGQEGTFFQDDDLGPIVTPAAEPAAAEPAATPTDEDQLSLLTQKGTPRKDVEVAAATGTLNPQQKTTIKWFVDKGEGLFPLQAATNLTTSEGVLVQPDTLKGSSKNIKAFTAANDGAAIELQLGSTKTPKTVVYSENLYGSPENFARVMGFDYNIIAEGTFVRHSKRGGSSDPQTMASFKLSKAAAAALEAAAVDTTVEPAPAVEPVVEPAPAAPKASRVKRGAKPAAKKPATKKSIKKKDRAAAAAAAAEGQPKDAVQEPASEGVDAQKQTGDGKRVRKKDTARGKPAGESEAKTTQEEPVREAVTVVDFPTTKKDADGRYTVTLSDGSTAKVYFDRSGTLGTGWYSDERSKFAPSQPEYVTDYLGTSREEAIKNLPGVLARLRAEKATPAAKAKAKAKDYSEMSNEDLLAEATAMDPKGKLSKEGLNQIQLLKELYIRVQKETDETEAYKISKVLTELEEVPAAKPLLERAAELANAEATTARASVAPKSLKKSDVKTQTIQKVVDRILSKLSPKARKGTEVQYAANMEDLKANNPQLYRLLERGREVQGDIGTVVPAAFYLRRGDGTATIVMFTDNIVDETHTALVFLEEMVSHHGFSSLLGSEVNPFMEKIYDENPEIAAAAEAYAKENKGVSKAEAVEEVIAKELARDIGVEIGVLTPSPEPSYVPVGILTRLINQIRKLLNKVFGKQTVGFMDDENVRVLFAKSKQFARTGTKDPVKSHLNFTGTYRGFEGQPRTPATPVLYHGSPNKVEGALRPSRIGLFGPGVYLTTDMERARGYAGKTGEVVEMKVSGKLATRDQWKAATKAASEGMKPSINAQTEIDNKAIIDLEAQGFVGVQAGNTVTVWKPENLESALTARFSVAPEGGPKAADRLTNEERAALGNTTTAEVYERRSNGESFADIADDLNLTSTIVQQIYARARTVLKARGIEPRVKKTTPKKPGKTEQVILALGTRKADGTYPSVEEVAEQTGAAVSTVNRAINEERQKYIEEGKQLPDFLLPPQIQSMSRLSEYTQTTTPLYDPQRPTPKNLAGALDWLNDRNINVAQLGRSVLNALKTMNFSSRSNAGYAEGYRILTDMKNKIAQLRTKYTSMLEDLLMNADNNVRREVSEMLQFTTKAKLNDLTDRQLRKYGSLFKVVGNNIVINEEVFRELSKRGRFTLEEFQKGITRQQDVPLFDAAGNPVFNAGGEPTFGKQTVSLRAMPNLTKDSPTWKLYERVRDTMDQAALDRVEADYAAIFGTREHVFRTIENTTGKTLTQVDKDFIVRIEQRYRELAEANATPDSTGKIVQKTGDLAEASQMIADFNTVLIADAKKKDNIYKERMDKFLKHFPEKEQAEVRHRMERFQDGMVFTSANQYDVQRVVSNLAALELGKEGTELNAKRSIAGGYIPIGRRGPWQTRIRVVDPKTGQVYGLMESFRSQLPYFQHEDRAAAENLARDINKLFPADKATMKLPVFDTQTKEYVVREVRLEAVADAARETTSVDPMMNINDFQQLITRFGISLTPEERERVIVGMTEQDARARTNLQRQNVEGADPDSVPYISEHLETLANISGRRRHQNRTTMLLDDRDPTSQRLWNGDPTRLKELEKRYNDLIKDPTASEGAITQVEREYNQLAFEMRRTQEEGGAGIFKDRFVRDLAFLEDQKALQYADFASDGLGQEVRTWTAVAQLGGSLATSGLQLTALPLNVVPALASYNPKTNFGGGFGFVKASAAVTAALKDVGGLGKYREKYYNDLLKNPEALANSGLTRDEAEFLAREIEFGNLQASLANALLAASKGRFGRNPKVQKFIDAYMSAFTYTEQASSRAAALAAYRLEKERLIDAGIDSESAQKMAGQFAIDIKNNTIGNYDMYNRPGAFRGGLRDFIFMYKMYPIMVVQLLSALSPSGKAAMLVPLLIFSGIKGLPGAEDFMDILDTIMQALGMKVGSSEKWLAEQLNEIAPGLTPIIMRGVVDQIVPATVSSRVGMGNLIPGTSMFVSGSNQFNELMDFLGPAAAFVEGSLATTAETAQLGLSTVGLSDRNASLTSVLRGSPVTMMRAVGDSLEYAQVGAIVDSKGYVSSYDLNASTYISRLLGFYPAAATRENDVVRVTKREADYLREVSTEFRRSYVKAALRNDSEGMQRVVQRVRDWNEAAKGTGLEVPNFAINARRAVQEARKTSSERFISSAPRSLRADAETAQEAYGVE